MKINIYQFGNGSKVKAVHNVKIPALFGNNYITIQTDIVENSILLLSKPSMKRTEMTLDFQHDIANDFGGKNSCS